MLRSLLAGLTFLLSGLAPIASAQWYAEADALAITRSLPDGPVFQRNQVAQPMMMPDRVGNQTRLSGNDLDLDFIGGGRLTVGYQGDVLGIEGSFLITDEWTETASVFDSNANLASPFSGIGATVDPVLDSNMSAILDYTTEMHSAELSLTQLIYDYPFGSATLSYGARYMKIDESLNYMADQNLAAPASSTLLIGVDNEFIGPQLGLICEGYFPGGVVDFTFKIAGLQNSVDKGTIFTGGAGPVTGTGTDSGAVLMSEIGADLILFTSDSVFLRFGYHAISLTDVALATDNLETNLAVLNSGMANVRAERGVIYQTLGLGLTIVH